MASHPSIVTHGALDRTERSCDRWRSDIRENSVASPRRNERLNKQLPPGVSQQRRWLRKPLGRESHHGVAGDDDLWLQ